MIRQARVEDIKNKRITRRHGRVVVVTRFYPRYLKKALIDEYQGLLAPPKWLLREFIAAKAEGHDNAFAAIDYENKFVLAPAAFSELERLSILAQSETVYLVCHCKIGERCHRELLMLLARELYGAPISKLHYGWSTFATRFSAGHVEGIEDKSAVENPAEDEALEDVDG